MSPSVLGSSVDPLSTDSPDQESSLSGEVNGVLRENNDPEAFSILEVPETAPDFLAEQNDVRANIPQCDRIHEVEALNGGLDLPLLSREDMEGSDVTGLGEEPLPMDDELNSEHLSFQEQNGPAEALILEPHASQGTFSEAPLPGPLMEPSSLFGSPGAEQGLPATRVDEGSTKEPGKEQDTLSNTGAPCHLGSSPWHAVVEDDTGQKETSTSGCDVGSMHGQLPPVVSALVASTHKPWLEQPSQDQALMSSDEEDIYAHGLPSSSSETSVTELGASHSLQDLSQPGVDATGLLKSDQVRGLRRGTWLPVASFLLKGNHW